MAHSWVYAKPEPCKYTKSLKEDVACQHTRRHRDGCWRARAPSVGSIPAQSIHDHEYEFVKRRSRRLSVFEVFVLRKARQEGLIREEARGEDQDGDWQE